jgi:hypothetical protein
MLGKQENRSIFGSKDDHRKMTKDYTPEDAKRDQEARLERRKLRQHMMPDGSMMNDEDMPWSRPSVMPRERGPRLAVMPRESFYKKPSIGFFSK